MQAPIYRADHPAAREIQRWAERKLPEPLRAEALALFTRLACEYALRLSQREAQ